MGRPARNVDVLNLHNHDLLALLLLRLGDVDTVDLHHVKLRGRLCCSSAALGLGGT